MSAHSKLGASSMYRWSACPGSVKLCEGIPEQKSSYAEEGTRAHELAAHLLLGKPVIWETQECKEAIELYVETVRNDAGSNKILVEQKFDLSEIHPGCFGTADAVVYDPDLRLLRVYDYKHGQGILVEVHNNSQLKYYGLGALLKTGYPCREVELVIVQPRANHPDGPVRRWRFDTFDLAEFAAYLSERAEATEKPNAPLKSGDHCRFCPAAGICPELSKKALAVAQTVFKPQTAYDPQALSETLKKLDVLEGYAKSVREFAYNEAQQGRCPPGFKLVQKRATRKWRDNLSPQDLSSEFDLSADKIYEPLNLKSPAQIEKILKKDEKKKLSKFTISISSGLALVEESDERAAALLDASSVFTKIEEGIF